MNPCDICGEPSPNAICAKCREKARSHGKPPLETRRKMTKAVVIAISYALVFLAGVELGVSLAG